MGDFGFWRKVTRAALASAWLVSGAACSSETPDAPKSEADCRIGFHALLAEAKPELEKERLALAEKLPTACQDFTTYKLMRAKWLILDSKKDEASLLLSTVRAASREDATELARLRLAIAYLTSDAETEKVATQVVSELPDSFLGYSGLARVSAAKRDFVSAVQQIEKSKSLVRPGEEEIAAREFVPLSLVYYNIDEPKEALNLIESGLQYDQTFMKIPQLASVAIISAAAVGDFAKAKAFVGMYLQFNQQGRQSDIQPAIDYLRQKLNETEGQRSAASA